jgi:hypothetical protein
MDNDNECGAVGGDWQGKPKYSEKDYPNASLSICPPQISPDMGWNPGHYGGKQATNRLSYHYHLDYITQTFTNCLCFCRRITNT